MKLLNVGCGGCRDRGEEWVNLDTLRTQLPPGTGARANLDSEPNYVEWDLNRHQMPFPDEHFDGILLAHVVEHFPAQKGVALLEDCRRLLKPDGCLLVSVPDASYFRKVYPEDENSNWPRLFGVTDPPNPIPTFFRAALYFEQHDMIFTEDSLWAHLVRAGFSPEGVSRLSHEDRLHPTMAKMAPKLDRLEFSLIMVARK